MRFLLTVLLLAVGASGQHTGVVYGLEPPSRASCCYRIDENGMLQKIVDPCLDTRESTACAEKIWEQWMSGMNSKSDASIDVPAVKHREPGPSQNAGDVCWEDKQWNLQCNHIAWTCTDKSRILEHDQQEPPKYWCRKVQP